LLELNKDEVSMEKISEIHLNIRQDNLIIRLLKDFFNPDEPWGRQNRNQFLIGLVCTLGYFLANALFNTKNPDWNPFLNSSNGLLITVFICTGFILISFIADIFGISLSKHPWYEKYMTVIIALLGLTTLMALQNLNSSGNVDAALWINIAFLLIVFIIASGYFVEGSSYEKVLKIWFALLGYYFSIIVFFYLLENFIIV